MPFNGSGVFNLVYNWENDANNNIPITASRMDGQESDMAQNGFDLCLTRDGQGFATANLPMGGFKHTGVAAATARTDYADAASVQDGSMYYAIAGGTANALTAAFVPVIPALVDGQQHNVQAGFANTTTTPTYSPSGLAAATITKLGGQALFIGDIYGPGHELILRYAASSSTWELINPSGTPGRPYLLVQCANSHSYSQATATKIPYDTVTTDTDGRWDASGKDFLCNRAGRYRVVVNSVLVMNGTTILNAEFSELRIVKNSSIIYRNIVSAVVAQPAGAPNVGNTVSGEVQLANADTISSFIYSDNTNPSGIADVTSNYMSITYVGP